MPHSTLQTTRLELVPHEPAHLLALIESAEAYARSSGLQPADGLRDFLVSPDVSPAWLATLHAAAEADPWMFGYAVVHQGQVVGSVSFKGPPNDDGAAEIAYGIVTDYCGRGIATEAAGAIADFAWREPRVRTLVAHTLPTNNASTRVLSKLGFRFAGEVIDPDDGPVWRWERFRS